MTEYINKTTAYEVLKKMEEEHNLSFSKEAYNKAAIMISTMPTEDVQPVIHAEWELVNEDENVYMCSNCGDEFITIDGTATENHMLYCPFCGAKMDKE